MSNYISSLGNHKYLPYLCSAACAKSIVLTLGAQIFRPVTVSHGVPSQEQDHNQVDKQTMFFANIQFEIYHILTTCNTASHSIDVICQYS